MRLDAEINRFAEQLLLGARIVPVLRQTKALAERCNQLLPPSIHNRTVVQDKTQFLGLSIRRLKGCQAVKTNAPQRIPAGFHPPIAGDGMEVQQAQPCFHLIAGIRKILSFKTVMMNQP